MKWLSKKKGKKGGEDGEKLARVEGRESKKETSKRKLR